MGQAGAFRQVGDFSPHLGCFLVAGDPLELVGGATNEENVFANAVAGA